MFMYFLTTAVKQNLRLPSVGRLTSWQ